MRCFYLQQKIPFHQPPNTFENNNKTPRPPTLPHHPQPMQDSMPGGSRYAMAFGQSWPEKYLEGDKCG